MDAIECTNYNEVFCGGLNCFECEDRKFVLAEKQVQSASSALLGVNHRKPTGLKDMDGKEIFVGDIVEFYFDADYGHSKKPDNKYTRMRDLVEEVDGEIYFTCGFGSSYAWRHVDYCRVIGDDKALIDT